VLAKGPMAALCALAVATCVAACGGGSSGDDDGPSARSAIKGTVTWSLLDYDPGVKPWAQKVAKAFEAEHPGVKVKVTLPPVNAYQQLLTTQVRGKNPPDLAGVPTAWIPTFYDAGVLRPWTGRLSGAVTRAIDPTMLKGGTLDGKLIALPYLSTARALFWNKTAFARAGIAGAPATWDDVIADAKRVKAEGGAKTGFALQGSGNETFAAWFPYVYWSYGGKLTGADGDLAIDQGACTKGVSVLRELVGQHLTQADVTASDVDEQLKLFTSGDAAMTVTGPWLVGTLASEAKGLKYGVAAIPAGTTSTTLDVADAYVLFKDGENPDAATAFAEFLYEPANADEFVKGRGMLPVLSAGFDAKRYRDGELKTFVDLARKGTFAPMTAKWLKLLDTGTRALQAMYVDGKSPEETCEAIASTTA
jgi:multiple sugar transport system substrate-binding protein